MRKITIFGALTLATAMIFSCSRADETSATSPATASELVETPFTIDSAFVSGDTLHALVQYSGGCGAHAFDIEATGTLLKSLPPKQPIRIVHRSDNDPCRALIIEEIKISIKEFNGSPRGTTVLMLENWNQHLSYSY